MISIPLFKTLELLQGQCLKARVEGDKIMRIGELAQKADLKVDTVRYYEKAGLLPIPPRRSNGYRNYDEQHVERLAFVRHCRVLGMSLADVKSLLELVAHPDADCTTVNRLIDDQLAHVQARIASLRTLEQQLLLLRAQCNTRKTAGECGILQELVAAAQHAECICHPTKADK